MSAAVKRMVTKMTFPHHDLTGIDHLTVEDISSILDLSDYYVAQNRRRSQSGALLKGLVMVNVFFENSTRTRLSFEMAAKRLGCEVLNFSTEGSSVHKGETVADTMQTLNAMRPDLVVIRHNESGAAREAAEIMDCPVLNGGDGTREHPTQALLDALTLRRHFGRLEGLKVTICGDIKHSRVAHSNILLLGKMGAEVTCAGPKELLPGDAPGATTDIAAALAGADAVMTLRIQKERLKNTLSMTDNDYFAAYGLTRERLALAKETAVVLDPGPMIRGVQIADDVADDPKRSLITAQVEMGVAVRMACLDLLTRRVR